MNIINWFITSSSDNERLSLTIKSIATIAVLFGVDSVITNEGSGYIVTIITSVGTLISAVTGLYGLGRKVYLGRWSATN